MAEHSDVPLCIMHMKGKPKDMQEGPVYDDVMNDIKAFLKERAEFAILRGVPRENILIDPGLGFGKTVGHNLEIIRRLPELGELGFPILIGPSRKSFIGKILDLPVTERLEGTISAVVLSIAGGAKIVRVHDVEECVRAVRIADAIVRG